MTKHQCSCGKPVILMNYKIHLEGTLTFRDYNEICIHCGTIIITRDLNQEDLEEQEYLC